MNKMNKTNRQNTRNNAEVSRATMRRTIIALDAVATNLRAENDRLKAELYIAQNRANELNLKLTRVINRRVEALAQDRAAI